MHLAHRHRALVHLLRLGAELHDRGLRVGEAHREVARDLFLPAHRLRAVVEALGFLLGDRRRGARGEQDGDDERGQRKAHGTSSLW
jgi:hypothetical protein